MFTTNEYIRAPQVLRPALSRVQTNMLELNCYSPDNTVSPQQMARWPGWSNRRVAHTHHGKLGRKIAATIAKQMTTHTSGVEHPVRVIAGFCGFNSVEWVMWEKLAIALTAVGLDVADQESHLSEEETMSGFLTASTHWVQVHLYGRSRVARNACIQHFGATCAICGFDFSKVYGKNMEDLIPVCPNCHAVTHSRRPTYSPDKVRTMLRKGASS